MEIIDAILLGIVQGFTEFIPVSSSGHLILLDESTSVESSFSFDVLLNIGTLMALLFYFRVRLTAIVLRMMFKRDYKLVLNILISTIPAVIVGGLFTDLFSNDDVRNLNVVIVMLIVVGFGMIIVDKIVIKNQKKLDSLTPKSALAVGLAQALALIPGTSRSGSTILAGRVLGLSYKAAAEYSFLIAIPILVGAILRSLFEPETTALISDHRGALFAGIVTSFITGTIAIHFMIHFLQEHGLKVFGIYRIIMAVALLLFIS